MNTSKSLHSDHSSVATYTPQTDGRSTNLSSNNTPQSDYGITPTSARASGFPPDPLSRYGHYHHAPAHHPGAVVTMAQPNSPSLSLPDGNENDHPATDSNHVESNDDVPIDPSISQASPTYPPPQYPYPPPGQHMSPYGDQNHPAMYAPRPDWPYGQHPGMQSPYGHPPTSQPPPPNPVQRPGQVRGQLQPFFPRRNFTNHDQQVYSFVPIPGAQQHKRPRRRYEEIERMYKCGWNGCEKAYGTLNHLNAHVTMQSHGQKRTPEGEFACCVISSSMKFSCPVGATLVDEVVLIWCCLLHEPVLTVADKTRTEFKEIRKEWKARKKEEENARKEEEQRHRAAAQQGQVDGQPPEGQQVQGQPYQTNGRPSLPPIGPYSEQHPQGQYAHPPAGMVYQQGNGQVQYPPSYQQSPYAPQGQVYQQRKFTIPTSIALWPG